MHLASITSQEENDKLEKHIRDFGKLQFLFIVAWKSVTLFRVELVVNRHDINSIVSKACHYVFSLFYDSGMNLCLYVD